MRPSRIRRAAHRAPTPPHPYVSCPAAGRCRAARVVRPCRSGRRCGPPGSRPAASGSDASTVTGPSLILTSPTRVQAPGFGVTARIRRSTTWAGRSQRTRASSTVTFGATVTPSRGCGTGESRPSAMPSSVVSSSAAPETDSRSRRSAEVSVGWIVSVTTPYTGPESSAGSIWNVVAPLTASPAAIAACTGAAPRHAGSSEKCRLIHPCAGTASRPSRSNAP